MNSKRSLKEQCYLEALESSLVSAQMVINQLEKIQSKVGMFDESVLKRDHMKTVLDLELALADLCILLRKMSENRFIEIDPNTRRDINSIIHSNRFDVSDRIVVYSQKGREEIDLDNLLKYSQSILDFDKEN